jgi:hypothetical protein
MCLPETVRFKSTLPDQRSDMRLRPFADRCRSGQPAPRWISRNGSERLVVDVADEDFCSVRREGARKFSTDTRGAGRYQDTLQHDSGINQIILPTARQRASTFTRAARSHIKCANRLRFSAVIRGLPDIAHRDGLATRAGWY